MENSVYINCPYNKDYKKELLPIIFAVLYTGYIPELTSLDNNCSNSRIDKVKKIIEKTKYSIHDISLLKNNSKKKITKLNMAFELGIDFGCKHFSNNDNHLNKNFLIFENHKNEHHNSLSDIKGYDIKNHQGNWKKVLQEVVVWLNDLKEIKANYSPNKILYEYNFFHNYLSENKIKYTNKTEKECIEIVKVYLKTKKY